MSFKFELMLFENFCPLSDCLIDGASIRIKISMRLNATSSARLYASKLKIINF